MLDEIIFSILLLAVVSVSLRFDKLTRGGALIASLVAITIFAGTGLNGILFLGLFFIIGVFATSWKSNLKAALRTDDEGSKRNAVQVLANGGIAGLLGLTALIFPDLLDISLLLIACSLSSATADTVSSELGMVYGKRFYNIITFKEDRRGENGVISLEGILLGLMGSIVIAISYLIFIAPEIQSALIIILAGTIGNIADSLLGTTAERDEMLGNNAVNFLNTLIAAAVGGLFML